MTSISLPPWIYRVPHGHIGQRLSSPPKRLKAGDRPIWLMCDAGLINKSDTIFPLLPRTAAFKRLMAFSKRTGRPIIFVSTDLEFQVLDHWKERRKQEAKSKGIPVPEQSKLRSWVGGATGKGIVQEFNDIRCSPFAHQYFIVGKAGLEGIQVESCYEDLEPIKGRKVNYTTCPPIDRARNDVRLQSMEAGALCLLLAYPGSEVHYYLRGERIAARFHERKQAAGQAGQQATTTTASMNDPLEQYGRVVYGSRWRDIYADLDRLGDVKHIGAMQQPTAYPSGLPTATGWSPLLRLAQDQWEINPIYRPRFPIPQYLTPLPNYVHRVILDNDILENRKADLLALVGKFRGKIEITGIAEVDVERGQGGVAQARARNRDWHQILSVKRSTTLAPHHVQAQSLPTVFSPKAAPTPSLSRLTGDLEIRIQINNTITHLESTFSNSHLRILFVTGDTGAGQLAMAVGTSSPSTPTSSSRFKCLRVDKGETGVTFVNIVCDALKEDGCI